MAAPVLSLDAATFARNRLTQAEQQQFAEDGYLIVEDAIPGTAVVRLHQILADMVVEKRTGAGALASAGRYHADEDIRQVRPPPHTHTAQSSTRWALAF